MANYLDQLRQRRRHEDALELAFELAEAFDEAAASDAMLTDEQLRLHELLRFCRFDAIAPWLAREREALARVADFARGLGCVELAELIEASLAGRAQPMPEFELELPDGQRQALIANAGDATCFDGIDWGGTDLAVAQYLDDFVAGVLAVALEGEAAVGLAPPRSRRQRELADAAIASMLGEDASAASLFARLLARDEVRLLAGPCDASDTPDLARARCVLARHQPGPPASADHIQQALRRYGEVARPLLEAHTLHDGAGLFAVAGEPGFVLVPMAQWPELLAEALAWAEEVTWADEPEAIPNWLRSAIAFGAIPGDSERWLLVTEGPLAGCVLLSDTDVIEESPRFPSLAAFFASLIADPARVLGCGGYVSYEVEGEQLYPIRCLEPDECWPR